MWFEIVQIEVEVNSLLMSLNVDQEFCPLFRSRWETLWRSLMDSSFLPISLYSHQGKVLLYQMQRYIYSEHIKIIEKKSRGVTYNYYKSLLCSSSLLLFCSSSHPLSVHPFIRSSTWFRSSAPLFLLSSAHPPICSSAQDPAHPLLCSSAHSTFNKTSRDTVWLYCCILLTVSQWECVI